MIVVTEPTAPGGLVSMQEPSTLRNLLELRRNADLGKFRHFAAARRCKKMNNWLGIPVVIINIALGSIFFVTISEEIPAMAKWLGAFLALSAALLGGVQTFFRFARAFEGHHRVANQYAAIVRQSESLMSSFFDNLVDLADLAKKTEALHGRYDDVAGNAEAYLTSQSDYAEATRKEKRRRKGLEKRGLIRSESEPS